MNMSRSGLATTPGQLPVRRLGVPHAPCVLRILCENKHAKKSNWLVRLKELNDLKLEIFLEDHLITENSVGRCLQLSFH